MRRTRSAVAASRTVYAAAPLVLLGAVVNAVLADRVTDRQLQQERLREVANGNP